MRRLLRSWRWRMAVVGHSMEPTLREGDWLLVDPAGYRAGGPVVNNLVVVHDPRTNAGSRLIVKRVTGIDGEGYLALGGDHPAHRWGSHARPDMILVPPAATLGRPWFRYWPPRRVGRL